MTREEYEKELKELKKQRKFKNKVLILILLMLIVVASILIIENSFNQFIGLGMTFVFVLILALSWIQYEGKRIRLESYNNEFVGLSYSQLVQIEEELDYSHLREDKRYYQVLQHIKYMDEKKFNKAVEDARNDAELVIDSILNGKEIKISEEIIEQENSEYTAWRNELCHEIHKLRQLKNEVANLLELDLSPSNTLDEITRLIESNINEDNLLLIAREINNSGYLKKWYEEHSDTLNNKEKRG
ncbi:hypothetical protein [Erysipelothrix aquatica]|uniref:hypothetical protein n=1 Tax=Erysipelothrix aquatica TaxID=2683714 RepID=UPI00135A60F0|nr:hypothetical protein [Erysipelothrix aquatica]